MTQLINLLSWQPGHSGFGSYVQRVMPGIPGIRLQLDAQGKACLIPFEQWMTAPPPLALLAVDAFVAAQCHGSARPAAQAFVAIVLICAPR